MLFKCDLCGQEFKNNRALSTHRKVVCGPIDIMGDNTLLGEIGEALARYYLVRHEFYPVKPVRIAGERGKDILITSSWVLHPIALELTEALSSQQREYLFEVPGWDYVGFKGPKPYLVEIKTAKAKSVDRRRKELSPERVSKARALGFCPLLLEVKLLNNWRVEFKETLLR